MTTEMLSFQFHPFDRSKKMSWHLWNPFYSDMAGLDFKDLYGLLLDRKTGNVFIKKADDITLMEWNQAAGNSAVIAVANEKECFL